MRHDLSRSTTGFTLVEMAIVVLIIGLALGMVLNATRAITDTQKRQLVLTQLSALDTAMANFVAQNKRLPCPADGTIASGSAGAGVENPFPATGVCSPAAQTYGVVPWVTLGLTESDATDPWFGRMTYRVDPVLAQIAPLLMDMSNCDPAGIGAVAGGGCKAPTSPCVGTANCTSPANYLAGKGLDVWSGTGAWAARQNNRAAGTGAAYVIISHGPSGAGAYNKGGALPPYPFQPGNVAVQNTTPPIMTVPGGVDETPNFNGQAIALPSAQVTTYRDAQLNDHAIDTVHFDDYLSHPTIMSVLNKANLGPRAH